jgi:serine/threonine-protein kinase
MAPEQWQLGKQDPRTDVYAAAVILCELVTGRLPYRVTRDWSAVLQAGARPAVEAPGVPEELATLLRSALAQDPAARPRDGRAWLTALLAIQERLDRPKRVEAPPLRIGQRWMSGADRRLVVAVAGVAAAVAAGALLSMLLS